MESVSVISDPHLKLISTSSFVGDVLNLTLPLIEMNIFYTIINGKHLGEEYQVRLEDIKIHIDNELIFRNLKNLKRSRGEGKHLDSSGNLLLFFSKCNQYFLPERRDYHKLIVRYIKNHISENITLGDIAKALDISYEYFTKIFKKICGISYAEYVKKHS